jgi:hypothetical protein
MAVSDIAAGLRELSRAASSSAEGALNEKTVRIAVTGLSRAGKTVFITSMLQNLIALGHGRNTLPRLSAALMAAGESRLKRIDVLPAGAASLPYFDFEQKFSNLAAEDPSWPPRTDDLAQISLILEIERSDRRWRMLGTRRIRLDILDYPGEWLLDLPLMKKTYNVWSNETLEVMKRGPREVVCRDFLNFLTGFDPDTVPDDLVLQRGHALYRRALIDCRTKLGMRYLQPGRFLCPGPRADTPFMWFFPVEFARKVPRRGSAGELLQRRFHAYKADMSANFFDTHFVNFDRQIVLVDILSALHAGREAYEDVERALGDIAACMDYGNELPRLTWWLGAAGRRCLARLIPRLRSRSIERIAFVATKADHVPYTQRDNLRNLVRSIAARSYTGQAIGRALVSYHAAASVVSTRDGTRSYNGHPMGVVLGVPVGADRERHFYPGDVPSDRPRDVFWSDRYFEMPVFIPPKIDPSGRMGIPHLELDTILTRILEDQL